VNSQLQKPLEPEADLPKHSAAGHSPGNSSFQGKKICHDGIGLDVNIADALAALFHILLEAAVVPPTRLWIT